MSGVNKFFDGLKGLLNDFKNPLDDGTLPPAPTPWPLPPGALAPRRFLEVCTRCDACVQACPHHAIGRLPDDTGSKWAGTPALNTQKAPCHLCPDLPCVVACEPGALLKVPIEAIFFGLAEIDPDVCMVFKGPECGACKPACPVGALTLDLTRPVINTAACNGCGLCRQACPQWNNAIQIHMA